MDTVIQLKSISKTYRNGNISVEALKDIDLTIDKGEYVAIMGASGSGKSTLMNILGCLDRPTEGTYELSGADVSGLSDNELSLIRNKNIGFVFQSFNLIPRNTALKNVELPMLYAGKLSRSEREERARKLLADVGLEEREMHMPNELSGGQRQRVAIARAMANDPPVIMADEPTGNLDSKSSVEIMEIFSRLNREKGTTVIMVTHEPDIAAYTKRIITFRDGRIISDVPNTPAHFPVLDTSAADESAEGGKEDLA